MYIFLKKIKFTLKTERVKVLFDRISSLVLFKIGLRCSETLFFYYDLLAEYNCFNDLGYLLLKDINFMVIPDLKMLLNFKTIPERMDFVPIQQWFDRGAMCLAIVLNNRVIAYTWVHRETYDNLGPAGVLSLRDDEVFIGPFYTDPEFRKMGLFQRLMYDSLVWLKDNDVNLVYGSCSISNIATIKVLVNSGFSALGIVNVTRNKFEVLNFRHSLLLNSKIMKGSL
ncbi:GNAT family N-acetyltransferase [Desulfoluna spongiiphila]|uniref:Acetyltransferase (GNAT) family protein n=1 Tax=Desulfoluna spongiiphila TaxID=419481 RepID=A0A1G5IDA8_9BACT|nr:GNAT family N-acetyltransferase [Desulfoluna spongiiphila]SCY73660.1 Acetyltransferase (GNAT) family protein [Desulfoluna spongiiphila]